MDRKESLLVGSFPHSPWENPSFPSRIPFFTQPPRPACESMAFAPGGDDVSDGAQALDAILQRQDQGFRATPGLAHLQAVLGLPRLTA